MKRNKGESNMSNLERIIFELEQLKALNHHGIDEELWRIDVIINLVKVELG